VKETVTDSFNGLAGSSSLCNDWTIAWVAMETTHYSEHVL
jgi:hypothetical protein